MLLGITEFYMYNTIWSYDTATGSDDIISRIFSQPNVVMYNIE